MVGTGYSTHDGAFVLCMGRHDGRLVVLSRCGYRRMLAAWALGNQGVQVDQRPPPPLADIVHGSLRGMAEAKRAAADWLTGPGGGLGTAAAIVALRRGLREVHG